jgi:hypothetical protein
LGAAGVAFVGGGAEASGAFEVKFLVEFGAGLDGRVTIRESGVVEFGLDGELERVEKSVGQLAIDAGVEQCALDFHDGEHDGFGAFEDGEFDAGVLVHADGASEADTATFTATPLIVKVTEGVVTEGGGAAFNAVGFDMGAGARGRH